jgi:hypothetical protein
MVHYCFALPYIQGGLELAKKFAKENTNTKEHDEFYKHVALLIVNIFHTFERIPNKIKQELKIAKQIEANG